MTTSSMRAALAATLCLVVPFALAQALANVYRCEDTQGVPLFSQYPCSAAGATTTAITSISVVTGASLTRSEQATLRRIEQRFHRNVASTVRNQQRARQRATRKRVERLALCTRARESLKDLRERKRGGYSLSQAGTLAAAQIRAKADVDEYC